MTSIFSKLHIIIILTKNDDIAYFSVDESVMVEKKSLKMTILHTKNISNVPYVDM